LRSIQTISTSLDPLRLSVNPFFTSPSGPQPLVSTLQIRSNVQSFFPADFRRNFFLIFNFQTDYPIRIVILLALSEVEESEPALAGKSKDLNALLSKGS
jgi:hypothetical protein